MCCILVAVGPPWLLFSCTLVTGEQQQLAFFLALHPSSKGSHIPHTGLSGLTVSMCLCC